MTSYRVLHETTYVYADPVVSSHNEGHLRPRQMARQAVTQSRLDIHPSPDTVSWRQDYFGNDVVYFDLKRPHDRLLLVATSSVDVAPRDPPAPERTPAWEDVAREVRNEGSDHYLDAYQFVLDSPLVPRSEPLGLYAQDSFPAGRPVLQGVVELANRIFREFSYDSRATHVATPIDEVLENRRGVCQDFAHLMIGCLRSLGLPARYVSGYVRATRSGSPRGDGPARRKGAPSDLEKILGAHASHAWVSAFCGEIGWVEIDPTNDLVVFDEHIVLGWGRDYSDVSPLKGVTLGGREHAVSVKVDVNPTD